MATKKSSKPGAVKYFNDLKVQGYKSAAKAMKEFKKNMPKAQYGESVEERLAIGKQKAAEEKRRKAEEGRAAVAWTEATQPWARVLPAGAPTHPGQWSAHDMRDIVNDYNIKWKKGGTTKKKSSTKSKKK